MSGFVNKILKNKVLIIILLIASVLRLYGLDRVPVSLFGDELDVGYHAYSVLHTGKDYSGNPWPLHFESLAEWRTPLYLYSVVPTVAIFGISPLGVRIPAAVFGILGVWGIYLLTRQMFGDVTDRVKNKDPLKNRAETIALISAAILAFSPWHIQYSRAAFEVTMLTTFMIFGLYFFFKSLNDRSNANHPKDRKNIDRQGSAPQNQFYKKYKKAIYLSISAALLISTPLIYSTAKLFMPIFILVLLVLYKKQLFVINRSHLKYALITALIIGLPTAYATLYTGGTQRFGYISVFTDPTIETEIGAKRDIDLQAGLTNPVARRVFHNKATFWLERISNNYLDSLSTQFLFTKGDLNLRHSIEGVGMFYKIEILAMITGMVFLVWKLNNKKAKLLLVFWIFFGMIPTAITRDGGGHATRLIIVLPPIVILMSLGLYNFFNSFKGYWRTVIVAGYLFVLFTSFIFYQHKYWIHNPFYSERWWHAGFKEAVGYIKENQDKYDMVIITNRDEPPWIFFAGWWEYPPEIWQNNKPDKNWSDLEGFGRVTNIDKYYFGSISKEIGIYALPDYIDESTIYVASAEEIGANLIREPERTPPGLNLLRSVAYPSGEPAFYILDKKSR